MYSVNDLSFWQAKVVRKVNPRTVAQLEAIARSFQAPLRDAFLAAIRQARNEATLDVIVSALQQTDPAAAIREGVRGLEFASLREQLANIVQMVGMRETTSLRRQIGPLGGQILADFDIVNPYAVKYARQNVGNLITEITHSTQEGIQYLGPRCHGAPSSLYGMCFEMNSILLATDPPPHAALPAPTRVGRCIVTGFATGDLSRIRSHSKRPGKHAQTSTSSSR
jgi:hypothetical protein